VATKRRRLGKNRASARLALAVRSQIKDATSLPVRINGKFFYRPAPIGAINLVGNRGKPSILRIRAGARKIIATRAPVARSTI
jgi:hypothetical protein